METLTENVNPQTPVRLKQHPAIFDIEEVRTKRQIKAFLNLPSKIYTEDKYPRYVMPLKIHTKMMMGEIGAQDKYFFLAKNQGQVVARLGVKVHTYKGTKRLHFGFFECMPEFPRAATVLLDHAHKKYPHLEMMGPFHFRQEDPYIGILAEGFDRDPYFLMSYNPPEYDSFFKKSGFKSAMDLFTYDLIQAEGCPEILQKNGMKSQKELGLKFRDLNMKDLWNDSILISKIFNEALAENWGFEEFEKNQIKEMVNLLKFFINPKMVKFALVDGKEVGCLMMIPNFNHIIAPSKGSLNLGLLWRYLRHKNSTKSVRGYALGVIKKFRSKGISSALTHEMWKAGGLCGVERCEISWVLENNGAMTELADAMGGKQQKVYRIFSRPPIIEAN